MIEFKLEPIKQMIITNLVQESLEIFLYHKYTFSRIVSIWIDGMIIELSSYTSCNQEYKDMTNGISYYEELIFVKYPKYTKSVRWNGGNYELMLLNYNNDPRYKALAKWIKSQPIWKTTPEELK